MITCDLCGKEVKTAQGLKGHKTFNHGITGSNTKQPVARLATEQLGKRAQQVSRLSDRVSKLSEQVELAQVGKLAKQDRALEGTEIWHQG